MSYSLDTSKRWVCRVESLGSQLHTGGYVGDYIPSLFRVWDLGSKLLKGGCKGDYIGEYYGGY